MYDQTCAFTGHRSRKLPWKYDETDSRCVELKAILAEQISALVVAGSTQFLSGMAEGVDLYCARIVLDLRKKDPAIKLHCILPCKEQRDDFPALLRETYDSILEQADFIVYVSRAYHKNCMLERDRFLVDHASMLLAVYNGVRRSGTGATVNYARKLGRDMILIDPLTLAVTQEGNKA